MAETAEQYINRLLSHSDGKDPLRMMRAAVQKVESLVKDVPPAQLRKRPTPERWSVAEILSHLAEDEIAIAWRIRMILSENGVPLQGFNQDAWVNNAGYLKKNPAAAVELYRVLRMSNIELLKSIPKESWNRYGIHSERGKETVERLVRMMAGHDISHMRQIEGILKKS